MCERKFDHKIKIVRTDNGTEFINSRLREYFHSKGIIMEHTGIYTPEQNGKCERQNRTIMESARALLYSKDLPRQLWAEAVNTAFYLKNITPNSEGKSPFELWTGKKLTFNHLRV